MRFILKVCLHVEMSVEHNKPHFISFPWQETRWSWQRPGSSWPTFQHICLQPSVRASADTKNALLQYRSKLKLVYYCWGALLQPSVFQRFLRLISSRTSALSTQHSKGYVYASLNMLPCLIYFIEHVILYASQTFNLTLSGRFRQLTRKTSKRWMLLVAHHWRHCHLYDLSGHS